MTEPRSAQSDMSSSANALLDALNATYMPSDRVVAAADRLEASLVSAGLRVDDCPVVLRIADLAAECDRYREAMRAALAHCESYLEGESGLSFVEPYIATRRAAETIRAALDQFQASKED